MKRLKNKNMLSVIFFAVVWLFWMLGAPAMLAYQEETQLFLFDTEMFTERMMMPGGMARYVAEMVVQFYNFVPLGSAMLAAIMTVMQIVMWRTIRRRCQMPIIGFALTFVPAIVLWLFQGELRVKLTFTIALLMALLALWAAEALRHRTTPSLYYIFLLLMTPALAWAAGPVVVIFALTIALLSLLKPKDYHSLLMIAYAPACIALSSIWAHAPISRLFEGIGYTMLYDQTLPMQHVVMAVFALMPFVIVLIPQIRNTQTAQKLAYGTIAAVGVMTAVVMIRCTDKATYEAMEYNTLVRAGRWEAIISKAEKQTPDKPLTVASLNLALAMQGQLLQRGFDFFQNGWEGAFPSFNKQYETSIMTAEIYYYLGLVNTAQRLDFEANEALGDNTKSVRVVKRLAETNLINGEYEAARRYLDLLEETLFYSRWAKRTKALLGNEKAIGEHPVYGHIRKLRLDDDFMFSDREVDKIMGHLLKHNRDNSLAVQYFLFLPQLEGDQQKYKMYLDYANKTINRQ